MIHQHIRLFPTHVFTFHLPENRNAEWKHYIEQHGTDSEYGVQTHSDLDKLELFKPLVDSALTCTSEINTKLGYRDDYELEITSMWGQVLAENKAFFPHTHSNNVWSGVYYAASADNDEHNTIEFFDSRMQAHVFEPSKTKSTTDIAARESLRPPPGYGIIFPSWLMHWVPTVSSGGRCSIAWNILMRGEFGDKNSRQWATI